MLHRVLWYCNELWRNQWLGPVGLRHLQEKRLRGIVNHAYDSVPLYKEKFDAQGIKPGDIRSLDDLQKLPFTTKQEIRGGIPDRSIARGFGFENCVRASTSGTTGGPMPIFYDKRFWDWCQAAWIFRKQWAIGVEPWRKVMVISYEGSATPDKNQLQSREKPGANGKTRGSQSLGPVVRLLRGRRRTVTLTSDANQVLAHLLKFDPRLVRGAPSYLRLLAEAMAEKGVNGLPHKVIRTEGELTDEATRRYLESSFGCKVFDEYSSWDAGNGAWQCTKREGYHIDADMLIMEAVRGNERVLPGERGEIVVTNLLNYAMPLIRYRVGDIGILEEKTCSCGRGLPLLRSVDGRKPDCFVAHGGRLVTPRTMMTAIQSTPGVSRYQVVQEKTNRVRIELMRREGDPRVSEDELVARCHEILGSDVEIEITVTSRENLRAKFRPVVSKLPLVEGLLESGRTALV